MNDQSEPSNPHSRIPQLDKQASAEVTFTGEREPLLKLALKVVGLNLITLQLYRFWGKTRLRRYFWQNIKIGDEPLEYTGTGGELFKGFLVAILTLAVFSTAFTVIQHLTTTGTFQSLFLGELVFYVLLLFLIQIAFYLLWRYRLSRTTWRGVRFALLGSVWHYLGLSIIGLIATIGTLGLATPWMRIMLWHYRLNHTQFGETAFWFNGGSKPLYLPWLLLMAIPTTGLAMAWFIHHEPLMMLINQGETDPFTRDQFDALADLVIWGIPLYLALLVLFAWYRVIELRHVLNHLHFGPVRLRADFRAAPIMGIFLLYGAILMGYFGGLGYATITNFSPDVFTVFVWFLAIGVFILQPVLRILIIDFGMAKIICSGLFITDPDTFDDVVQSTVETPTRGEGFADALDVGGF